MKTTILTSIAVLKI